MFSINEGHHVIDGIRRLILMAWAHRARRLAAGLGLLLVLCCAAALPASAHGGSHDRVGHVAPALTDGTPGWSVSAPDDPVLSAPPGGMLSPGGTAGASPVCCDCCACPMFSATVAAESTALVWRPEASAAFGYGLPHPMAGLASTPGAEPPRLDV